MKDNGLVHNVSNYDRIAQRAYELWEKDGQPQGKETEHWLQAEAEIKQQEPQRGQEEPQRGRKNGYSPEQVETRRGRRVFAV